MNDANPPGQPAECEESRSRVISIEYFDDTWNSVCHFVVINRCYIFQARHEDAFPEWELIPLNSKRWSDVHQRIYRNFRSDQIKREALPANLPPPPDEVPPEFMCYVVYPPPEPIRAEDYPYLAEYMAGLSGSVLEVFMVLYEDIYDSRFGDGKFHDPEEVFFQRSNAEKFMEQNKAEFMGYHLREGQIRLQDGVLDCHGFSWERYDEYSARDVVKMTNAKLERNSSKNAATDPDVSGIS